MGVERIGLEDHCDVSVLRGDVVDDPVTDAQLPGGDVLEACDAAQGRGLATARRADEDHELPVGDLQVQCGDTGGSVAVDLGDLLEGKSCHGAVGLSR